MRTQSRFAFALLCVVMLASVGRLGAQDSIRVTVVGTIRTGINAIGGETTGTIITSKGVTWELELGKNKEFRETAKKNNGKKVMIQGTLEVRRGVEVRQRWIVTVTSLKPAGAAKKEDKPTFRSTGGKPATRVKFEANGDTAIIDISGSGIDKVTIERMGKEWPGSVVVRLHFRGLESFQLGIPDTLLTSSITTSGNQISTLKHADDPKLRTLDKESPYYSKIDLGKGYFDVPIPAKILKANPRRMALKWIDFYRN